MDKQAVIIEIDELIVEGKTKVLSTKWDYSGTGIIGFGTYVDHDVFYSWRMKTMSFLKLFLDETHEYVKVFENLTKNNYSNASTCVQTLENVKNYIQKGYINFEQKKRLMWMELWTEYLLVFIRLQDNLEVDMLAEIPWK